VVPIDLHVHTALSPCGDEAMRPAEILLTAERRGIRVLGIVDHSTAGNATAVVEAAPAFAVRVFVGVEAESAEGVHLLGLFDSAAAALSMDREIAAHLPNRSNRPDLFGEQYLLDEWGHVLGIDKRLLVAGTDLSVEELATAIAARGGMTIPAHIDRSAHGLIPLLGLVPPRLQVELFEVSRHLPLAAARERWPGLPLITASDAHCLDDIGSAPTWIPAELAAAPLGAREWARAVAEAVR
jgi:hypothetical protein